MTASAFEPSGRKVGEFAFMTTDVSAQPMTDAAHQKQLRRAVIAILEASQVLRLSGSQTASFSGQIVDATSALVMHTIAGDANLSGFVDADDYFQIDAHHGRSDNASKSWLNGDFNYDGRLDADDYAIIDAGFVGQQSAAQHFSTGVTSVPEPSFAIIAAALTLAHRRRRPQRIAKT